eukprot:TRINITY_DN57802_c0_g1_i1.p2 TRINITY_DN57802_c0_g1~~TRINITY_DN57802_c0_g1_i1.p2  ORF type:complete len:274 (+),score=110.05 TRINITY_DN57802_c0_g1_i1:117-938(+)
MAKPEDTKNNWADMMEDEPANNWAADEPQYETIPQGHESAPDTKTLADGTKMVSEIVSKDGGKFKVTKHIKTVTRKRKIYTAAEERQKRWVKFGKAAEGNQSDLTVVCELSRLELGKKEELSKNRVESEIQKMVQKVSNAAQGNVYAASKRSSEETTADGDKSKTTYVPPGGRVGGAGETADGGRPPRDDSATVRITNLSEDISDDDLRGLFHKYGHITRSYIAVDRATKERRGFAFITYKTKEEAAEAIKHLDRHALCHVILEVGWARPQKD